jgi:outer membrane protein OmpA-like peptidoglycan-associated protein
MKKMLFLASLTLVFANAETMQTKSDEMIASPKGTFKDESANSQSKVISVIFYRLNGDINHVATVKAGDNVVGSLLPNHYATTKACKNKLSIGVAERGDTLSITHDLGSLENILDTVYIKVIEPTSNNKFTLSVTDPKIAQKDITSFNQKSNIINRHIPNCGTTNTIITSQSAIITLGADAMFATNSSYIKPEGKKELDKFIGDSKNNNIHISALSIAGYTDYLGSDEYNLFLSQKRADRVSDYLKNTD